MEWRGFGATPYGSTFACVALGKIHHRNYSETAAQQNRRSSGVNDFYSMVTTVTTFAQRRSAFLGQLGKQLYSVTQSCLQKQSRLRSQSSNIIYQTFSYFASACYSVSH